MYTKYYGLRKNPFDLTTDSGPVFMGESHQEALAVLRYGVMERKGFLLLTGDVGTGKTTLLHLLLRSLDRQVRVCLLSNPSLTVDDFYYTLAAGFGLTPYAGSKARFMEEFTAFLAKSGRAGERVLLIIDEAQVLPVELLEEIRLLSNQQGAAAGVLGVFLVGQPELNQRLGGQRLLPLRQRIAIRFHLESFDRAATAGYITFRLQQAGARRFDLFSAAAIDLIHKASGGVPRLINILADQALLTGFAESRPVIEAETVRACVQDLHIPGEAEPLPLPVGKAWQGRRPALWGAGLAALLLVLAGVWIWQGGYFAEPEGMVQAVRRLFNSWARF
ncbi:ExeA family protein [Desulfurivibrio sp. D14AmB]|uniref:ExeA family protein n=1 Tax=Desulfurivibrio sp. D14AmB TaxID=3374370 RepID=UPI00376EF852